MRPFYLHNNITVMTCLDCLPAHHSTHWIPFAQASG